MKILIKPRKWIEHNLSEDGGFCERFNFISIFSSKDLSPLPEQKNILKLEIDDITDGDIPQFHSDGSPLILFNGEHAEKVISFIHNIDRQKTLVVHCDAGISRSGAVGLQLNKYCNSIFEHHPRDYESFFNDNPDIMPNPTIVDVLAEKIRNLSNAEYNSNEKEDKRC